MEDFDLSKIVIRGIKESDVDAITAFILKLISQKRRRKLIG